MAKFRVIKGGTILLALAFVVLAIVVVVVLISAFGGNDAQPVTAQVFADSGAIIPSPYSSGTPENEHTDSIASVPGDIVSRVLPSSGSKRILIYHTHTHEAYQMTAANEYEPSIISRYALNVCTLFNQFYHNCRILGSGGETESFRLALTEASRNILGRCLDLLHAAAALFQRFV